MSGNPSGTNVVPMPHAAMPAQPQMPVPFPMWGGGGSLPWGPGCCPPGGMDALMKCYCDVQAATAFICSVMVQCIQTNPAVTAAIIAAIEASGSTLPLLGVTNGVAAQPGQVGEFIQFVQDVACPSGITTQAATLGVLQPGDWDCWAYADPSADFISIDFYLNPEPPGFSGNVSGGTFVAGSPGISSVILAPVTDALISVPSLINYTVVSNVSAAMTLHLVFSARRAR